MRIKGTYATRSAMTQLLILLLSLLTRAVLSSIISTGLLLTTRGLQTDITQDANLVRLIQFISAIRTFLLPSIIMAWICSDNPRHYLPVKKITDGRIWTLTLVCVFLFSSVINLLGLFNKQMELPAFMAPIEEWMRARETLVGQLMTILLPSNSIWAILANPVVIVATAEIAEEFLFRETLQRVIGKWTSNPHTVIWVAAILFSAFHLQLHGFLPRMILRTYFGYLLYWSKSTRISVFAHFISNAFAVIGMLDSCFRDNEFITGDIPAEHLLDFYLIAALPFLLFILVNRRLKRLL